MNDMLKVLTPDREVGWDQYGQLWRLVQDGEIRRGTIIGDVRNKICAICRHGWELTGESMADQYHLDHRAEWAHQSCFIRYGALKEYDFWCDALVDAGFMFGTLDDPTMIGQGAALESIPNGYWNERDPWGAGQPWYRARLLKRVNVEKSENGPLGRTFKLGSRKRVYHMEIEPGFSPFDGVLAKKLFDTENVTKDFKGDGMFVHAWGKEKAREYLRHFAEILGVKKR